MITIILVAIVLFQSKQKQAMGSPHQPCCKARHCAHCPPQFREQTFALAMVRPLVNASKWLKTASSRSEIEGGGLLLRFIVWLFIPKSV